MPSASSLKFLIRLIICQSAPFQARIKPIMPDKTPIQKSVPNISDDKVESHIKAIAIIQNQTGRGSSMIRQVFMLLLEVINTELLC